jgi:hypothetical protein
VRGEPSPRRFSDKDFDRVSFTWAKGQQASLAVFVHSTILKRAPSASPAPLSPTAKALGGRPGRGGTTPRHMEQRQHMVIAHIKGARGTRASRAFLAPPYIYSRTSPLRSGSLGRAASRDPYAWITQPSALKGPSESRFYTPKGEATLHPLLLDASSSIFSYSREGDR